MSKERMRFTLKAYDHRLLDYVCGKILGQLPHIRCGRNKPDDQSYAEPGPQDELPQP